jgi:hypothetical protein
MVPIYEKALHFQDDDNVMMTKTTGKNNKYRIYPVSNPFYFLSKRLKKIVSVLNNSFRIKSNFWTARV